MLLLTNFCIHCKNKLDWLCNLDMIKITTIINGYLQKLTYFRQYHGFYFLYHNNARDVISVIINPWPENLAIREISVYAREKIHITYNFINKKVSVIRKYIGGDFDRCLTLAINS